MSNLETGKAIDLLLRDVESTLGRGYEQIVRSRAVELLTLVDNPDYYVEKLVGDVQQYFHDCRVDTDWPRCPVHSNHALWFQQNRWECAREKITIAPLGSLKEST